jgi:hypothetical protein
MSKVESSCSCDAATPHLDAGYFAQFGPLLHTMISSSPQSRAPFLNESSGGLIFECVLLVSTKDDDRIDSGSAARRNPCCCQRNDSLQQLPIGDNDMKTLPIRKIQVAALNCAFLLTAPLFARESTDVIVMKNGDHLTGEIKGLNAGVLYMSMK